MVYSAEAGIVGTHGLGICVVHSMLAACSARPAAAAMLSCASAGYLNFNVMLPAAP